MARFYRLLVGNGTVKLSPWGWQDVSVVKSLLLLQGTHVSFPAYTLGGSQQNVTEVLSNSTLSSGLCEYLHTCTHAAHIHICTCLHTYIHKHTYTFLKGRLAFIKGEIMISKHNRRQKSIMLTFLRLILFSVVYVCGGTCECSGWGVL